jgi:hypothetical protein
MRRSLVLLAAILLACELPTAPTMPAGAVPFAPPPEYALWWRMTEACSGLRGDLSRVQWYEVPDAYDIIVGGRSYQGYWYGSPDRIVLAGLSSRSPSLVRHEMLHVLSGKGGHPRHLYLGSCEGIVSCVGECIEDAGGRETPPADAREILPHELHTRLELAPLSPSHSADGGAIAAIISVTNPHPYPVWVRLTPVKPDYPFSKTFGLVFDYNDVAAAIELRHEYVEGNRFGLAAGETRRSVWDDSYGPGRYALTGYFNADTTARVTFTVGP